MVRIVARPHGEAAVEVPPLEIVQWIQNSAALVWVDIRHTTDDDYLWLGRYFDFHPLAMDDVLDSHLRSKMDLFGDHAFLVFYGVTLDEAGKSIGRKEIELFLGSNYVVTVHDQPVRQIDETFARWQSNASLGVQDIHRLLYEIIDSVLDAYFPVLDWVAEQLDSLETRVMDRYDREVLREVVALKQDLLQLRKVVGPQRDTVNALMRDDLTFLPATSESYFHDLYDHTLRIVENVDSYREMATTIMDGLRSSQSNEINEIMRRLTILNLLFLPLAVLTGFFGMNFVSIPFESPLLLFVALLAMLVLPLGLYYFIRHKHWV